MICFGVVIAKRLRFVLMYDLEPLLSHEILAETPSVIHQNKPKSLGYHHAEAYHDPST